MTLLSFNHRMGEIRQIDFIKKDGFIARMVNYISSVQPLRIGILPIEGFAMMSYSSLAEPFRAANQLSGNQLYEIINLNKNDNPVASSGGRGNCSTGPV